MIQIFQNYHKDSYIVDISTQISQEQYHSHPKYSSESSEYVKSEMLSSALPVASSSAYKEQFRMQIMSNVQKKFG